MLRIAVVDDDGPINDLYTRWIREARPDAQIDQLRDRESAEKAFEANKYDLICLDIELRPDKNAGIGLIKNLRPKHGPVLVISSLNSEVYRPIMKELDAWDYLVKPLGEEQKDYFVSFVSRALRERRSTGPATAQAASTSMLEINPLNLTRAMWKGKKLNLPLTGQRIVRLLANEKGKVVSPRQLYELIPTGHNLVNLRAHIQVIRDAFKEVDPDFDKIHSVPAEGYFWKDD